MHDLLEKLLALPAPFDAEGEETIDYLELAATAGDADFLSDLLLTDEIPAGLDEEDWSRVRVHAWRALGERGEMKYFDLFLALLRVAVLNRDDDYSEEFVSLMAHIGDEAVPPLLALLCDPHESEELRANMVLTLDTLAESEGVRDKITEEYARFLGRKEPSRLLNGFIVGSLIGFKAVQHAPVIREIHEENLVNVAINGDLEEVEVLLGIRETRRSERPNWAELEKTLAHQARRDELGPPPDTDDPLEVLTYFLALHGNPRSFRSVSMLDGFLLACVCAPQPIPPSRYMPRIWTLDGDPALGPLWDSMEEAQHFHEALMKLHNAAVESLQAAAVSPVVLLEDYGKGPKERFHDWALGALTGTSLWNAQKPPGKDLHEMLCSELTEVIRLETENEDAEEGVGLPPLRRALALLQGAYDQLRGPFRSSPAPGRKQWPGSDGDSYEREAPKIGRNDPCPCGSGKKYKKCCMR